jgi:hypothetical protein
LHDAQTLLALKERKKSKVSNANLLDCNSVLTGDSAAVRRFKKLLNNG